jgi:rSAM/selenodomain-associated transferase 1
MDKIEFENGLIVFVKNPILGKVKTRIAEKVGEKKALEIYVKMLNHLKEWISSLSMKKWIYFSNYIDGDGIWSSSEFEFGLQKGKDLGIKMYSALFEVLTISKKAILIGSDIAGLNPRILEEAFQMLEDHDLVFGPANDGGYYLVGCKKNHPEIFDNIPWSTSRVLEISLEKAANLGLRGALLPPLNDIDYIEDWEKNAHLFT